MPANPKLFISSKPYFISSRIQEGLPLVPCNFINEVIWGILSRSYKHYPVEIIGFIFQRNHFHLALVAQNADLISSFMKYLKQELAHAINRMLGRRKRTIWEEGYDSPILLTSYDVMRYLVYLYTNPVKDGLVESIEAYPGVSSWNMMKTGNHTRSARWIRRKAIPEMPDYIVPKIDKKLLSKLQSSCPLKQQLKINPFGWLRCFTDTRDLDPLLIKRRLLKMIEEEQGKLNTHRTSETRNVMGADRLKRQNLRQPYMPRKFSPRMICLSSDVLLRKKFISWFKTLRDKAKQIYSKWSRGDYSIAFPPGMFPPRGRLMANWLAAAFVT